MTDEEVGLPDAPEPSALPASGEGAVTWWNRAGLVVSAAGFGVALGTATLVLPLLALGVGYDAATVGVLAAISAISHFLLRLALPWMLGRFTDRSIVVASCLMMAGSYASLLLSTALPVFVVAQLLQGGSRGLFWTASQTHVVRSSSGTVRSLAQLLTINRVGTLAGPALAGIAAATSMDLGLLLGMLTGITAAGGALLLRRLPPFVRQPRPGAARIWRRPTVELACWSSFASGGWRAMLNTYVPVILDGAGFGPSLIGFLLAAADVASLVATTIFIRVTPGRATALIEVAVAAACMSLVLFPFVAESPAAAAVLLVVVGAASGVQMTLAPAIANDAVEPEERGEAIAVAGAFRAGALLLTPATIAGALSIVLLPVAVAATAGALAVPVLAAGIRSRQPVAKAGVR